MPEHVQRLARELEIVLSSHASEGADRYGYGREDIKEIFRTGEAYRTGTDEHGEADCIHSMTGRDTRGRLAYLAAKVVTEDDEEDYLYIITIHPPRT